MSLFQQFYSKLGQGRGRVPKTVQLELTTKCNLGCLHCYNFDRSSSVKQRSSNELSDDEVLAVIDSLVEAGCWGINFTGGEVMARRRLFDFITHARKSYLNVSVKTNGTLLTPKVVQRLDEAGVNRVDISLYGANAETHDRFTQKRGSFDATVAACKLISESNLLLYLSVSVWQGNYLQLGELEELASELGASVNFEVNLSGRFDGTRDSQELAVDEAQLEYLYLNYPRLFPIQKQERKPHCNCGGAKCAILANGDVVPCVGAPVKMGNVRDTPFLDIWNDAPGWKALSRLTADDFPDCKDCELLAWCRRTSGNALLNAGDYFGKDPFACKEAAIRKKLWEASQVDSQTYGGDTLQLAALPIVQ